MMHADAGSAGALEPDQDRVMRAAARRGDGNW